jgi:hypothetical protein
VCVQVVQPSPAAFTPDRDRLAEVEELRDAPVASAGQGQRDGQRAQIRAGLQRERLHVRAHERDERHGAHRERRAERLRLAGRGRSARFRPVDAEDVDLDAQLAQRLDLAFDERVGRQRVSADEIPDAQRFGLSGSRVLHAVPM